MTRFARAKGSKSSNQRVPEEATPWNEMKRQLLDKNKEAGEEKGRREAEKQRQVNYKSFLDELKVSQSAESQWAEFPEDGGAKKPKKSKSAGGSDLAMDNIKHSEDDDTPLECSSKIKPAEVVVKKPKLKKKSLKITVTRNDKEAGDSQDNVTESGIKRKRVEDESDNKQKQKKTKVSKEAEAADNTAENQRNTARNGKRTIKTISKNAVKSKTNNVKGAQKTIAKKDVANLTEAELKKIEKKKLKLQRQKEKKKLKKEQLKHQTHEPTDEGIKKSDSEQDRPLKKFSKPLAKPPGKFNQQLNNQRNKFGKFDKFNKEKPTRRKDLQDRMIINGKEVNITYVDGFPIKSEDAARIKELKAEMIKKGLPKSEIQTAFKLERRKAEKAFAREKKKVCFNCRKSGHNLSECPQLESKELIDSNASGICYKCGSTEHTHFECKVVKNSDFRFAKCFICGEVGHISRQCPDNARGLYPKGGSCRVCGDVTHLKKDCPQYQAQQQREYDNVDVNTLDSGNPDTLLDESGKVGISQQNKRANKIIKF